MNLESFLKKKKHHDKALELIKKMFSDDILACWENILDYRVFNDRVVITTDQKCCGYGCITSHTTDFHYSLNETKKKYMEWKRGEK